MSDASNNTGFFVKVTNSNSGVYGQSLTPLISYNLGPQWVTGVGANVGSGITNQFYTTGTTPFSAIDASDIHVPVTYAYTSGGQPLGASGVLLSSSLGKLFGQMPTALNNSGSYTFTAQATDASGSLSVPRIFTFTINPTSYTLISPTGAVTTNFFTPNLYSSTGLSIPFVAGATTTGYLYTLTFNTDVSVNLLLKGGNGGGGFNYNGVGGTWNPYGGGGAWAYSQFHFAKNVQYKILIGGGGSSQNPSTNPGSYVNGGGGLTGNTGFGGQGGGYTGLFTSGGDSIGNTILIAGGGGGGAYETYFYTSQLAPSGSSTTVYSPTNGGSGGDFNGIDGLTSNSFPDPQNSLGTSGTGGGNGGGAGTQIAGGSAGATVGATAEMAGSALKGGNCAGSGDGGGGGGGGGGYYGGGAGSGQNPGSSGGGGSSYFSASAVNAMTIGGIPTTPGQTNGSNGYALLYYSLRNPVALTYVSGTTLPSPTVVNNSLCYSFIISGGVTTSYTFTINYPVVLGYLCVAGGGGGGGNGGGGGGGGGLLQGTTLVTANSNITITVGRGGATSATAAIGNSGDNSSISGGITSTITSIGGGGGGSNTSNAVGGGAKTGGSGGGGGNGDGQPGNNGLSCSGGLGTVSQGYPGGFGLHYTGITLGGGGGGGAGCAGQNMGPIGWNGSNNLATNTGGTGGKGIYSYITGSQVGYAGGGGGGMNTNTGYGKASGWGGGGTSSNLFGAGNGGGGGNSGGVYKAATAGTANTGGGGGGGEHPNTQIGAAGGSGIVIIRIPQLW